MPINQGEGRSDPQPLPEEEKPLVQQLVERVGGILDTVQEPVTKPANRQPILIGLVLTLAIAVGTGNMELAALAATAFGAGAVSRR